ncbi:MAG: hypothetical protein AMXMBFR8_23260 [Nevskiales bacterium]
MLVAATLALAGMVAGLPAVAESGKKTYRWVDKDGVVHFGDHVPSEYAASDRQVLNEYGVPIANQDIALTADEVAAKKAAAKRAEDERKQALLAARRDQVLLDTYLTVEEIEALRDRRLELIDTQIKVTENYLTGLREILSKLQQEASAFKPYSADPQAPPIDERLARELANTMDSIMLYEKNLTDTKTRKNDVVGRFAADIDRFRTLKAAAPAE